MGFLQRMFERRAALSLTDPKVWRELGIIQPTAAGVSVSGEGALKYTAVLAAVRVLAESVATLPLLVYERLPGEQGKRRAPDFYLYELLHDKPNPYLNSFEFRELMQVHLLLWGNAYAEIESDSRGRIMALWPLVPGAMETVSRGASGLVYEYRLPDGTLKKIPGFALLHLRGLGTNGLTGLSPIGLARQAIGLGLAAEQFGAGFFGNGAQLSGILKHPLQLSDEAEKSLRESWQELYSGIGKAHRIAILEEGMEYERIGVPPEDAQFLETRKFQVTEIARIYRVPPHMLGDLDRATFSNIEHQSLEFVMHSLQPWLVRWEMAIAQQLMTAAERARYFPEFLVDGLLRGDIASRYQAYAVGRQNGWMSANDIRRLENMNPVEGGDVYLVPLNMVPADQVGQMQQAPAFGARASSESPGAFLSQAVDVLYSNPPFSTVEERAQRTADGRQRLQEVHRPVFEDTAARVLRREANDVGNAAKRLLNQRGVPEFSAWLDEFYAGHAQFTARQWLPVLQAYSGLVADEVEGEVGKPADPARYAGFIASYAEQLGERQAQRSRARLDAILEEFGDKAQAEIESTMLEWRTERPKGVGHEETVRSGNAFAVALYGFAGVRLLRWVARGKTCPYCTRLNGKVVGIQKPFIAAGMPFAGDAPAGALTPSRDVGHAPAHRGCDCVVVAEG